MLRLFAAFTGGFFLLGAALFWLTTPALSAECGRASFYCCEHHGRLTASGEVFDQNALTAASNTLPMGTRVTVRNVQNGQSVQVRINDTGGFAKYGRVLDLSRAAFAKLAPTSKGVISVCLEKIR